MQHNTMKGKPGAILALKITTRNAEGEIIAEEYKENDIYLWNWAVFLAQILKLQFAPLDATTYGYKSTQGTARVTTNANLNGNNDPGNNWGSDCGGLWRVQIGGGTNAPAITDYSLQTWIKEVQPTIPDIVTATPILKIVFSSTFSFTADTTVSETAVKATGMITSGITSADDYILTRDIFTPVTVPAGGTVTLQHELWFNGTPS